VKVFITGAQGQVGKELVLTASAAGLEVCAATRADLDITQINKVEEYILSQQPDVVINAAAYTAVDRAEQDSAMAYAINHRGAENLAVICAQQNILLLHISTDYVFDGTKTEPYNEDDPVFPLGVYGKSKWQGEQAIREHLKNHIILRVAWVFGTQGTNFVKTMLRLAKDREVLNVVADQYGGPSPAKDISQVIINLVKQYNKTKTLSWGTYHYCGSPKTTWHAFAKEIFKQAYQIGLLDKEIQVNPISTNEYPTAAQRPKNSMLNCSRLNDTFGIEMPNWRVSLKQVLIELKSNQDNDNTNK